MVQPFLPNEADAFNVNQAEPDSVDFEILLLGHQRTGVLSGCAVTESSPAAQTIDVAVGEVVETGEQITVSVQADVAVSAADGSNPRIDLVSVNASGTVVVTAGTAAAQPVMPAVPATSVPLATLYVAASDNTHADNQINDKRVFVADRYVFNVMEYGATGDGSTDDTAAIQATWDAMTTGGTMVIPPGNYRLASSLIFVNGSDIGSVHIAILASGAIFEPDAGVTALVLSSNENPRFGPSIRGLKVNGASGANTNGIKIHNGNHWKFHDVWVENCDNGSGSAFGIQMSSENALAGYGSQVLFSEGNHFYGVWVQDCDIGFDIVTTGGGNGSFAETVIGSMIVRFCDIGFSQGQDCRLHRSFISGITCFMQDVAGVKGFLFDGNLDEVQMSIATEAPSSPSNVLVSVEIGANAINTERVDAWISFTAIGSLPNQDRINILNGGRFPYREGGRHAGMLEIRPEFFDTDQATGILLGAANILSESGDPEGADTAPVGSILLRDDGALGTALYYKASGAGNTGWRPVGTGAIEESGAFTLDWEHGVVNVDTSGGTVVVTLPDVSAFTGKSYLIRRDGANVVTIDRAGSDTFDDADVQKTLDSDSAAIGIFSIGDTEWKIVATEGTVGGS